MGGAKRWREENKNKITASDNLMAVDGYFFDDDGKPKKTLATSEEKRQEIEPQKRPVPPSKSDDTPAVSDEYQHVSGSTKRLLEKMDILFGYKASTESTKAGEPANASQTTQIVQPKPQSPKA